MSRKNQQKQDHTKNGPTKKEIRKQQIAETQERKKQSRFERKRWVQEKKKRQYGDAEWKSDFLSFSGQLESIGLTIKDVAGDGNCLFRAMSDQFTGDPNGYANYRRQICDYIYHNREDFEPFIEDDEPFEEYIARMRRNATWGGHLEIQACSMLYQVTVTIHQINQPRWELGFPGIATKTIHFSYHQGQHYSSVRMIGDISRNGPPAPIELNIIKPRGGTSTQKKQPEIIIPTEEELLIMDHTGCTNLEFIRHVLMENFGDIDASVEFIFIIGPDNTEFQREYLDKPYDPTNFEKPSQPTETNKEKKNQQAEKNKNNNNNRAVYKPQPEIKKEPKINKPPAHESNKERKQRLKMEREVENELKPTPPPPTQTPQTEPPPNADEVSILSVDLGAVQI